MRNAILLDNVSAGVQQISDPVNLDQRAQWKLSIDSDSLDGEPKLFIEQAVTKSECVLPTEWSILCNPLNELDHSFPINDNEITIEKKDFKMNWFRVRVETSSNTSGTITVKLSYKTFP